MKLSEKVLRAHVSGPMQIAEYLDLANMSLVSTEGVGASCPHISTLLLQGNHLHDISDLEQCRQLWRLDLSNNKLWCLSGLCRFVALGTLVLCNNDIDWPELAKIRHMHILSLSLQGNELMDKDPYYRIHIIDCLPNVSMLDGKIITSAERLRVKQFFLDSALTSRPVRHKLSKKYFVPHFLRNIEVFGVFGKRAIHMMSKFPATKLLNIENDQRCLQYLAYNLQEDMLLEQKYTNRELAVLKYHTSFLQEILNVRPSNREKSNMLLLLLVASLEFSLPSHLVKETLDTTKLSKIGPVHTMDLFLLPRYIRCEIIQILLGAVKLDKDRHETGGLYDSLYLCLYHIISELSSLQHMSEANKINLTKQNKTDQRSYRSILASEVVQLFCIVPAFFEYIDKDAGVMSLVCYATQDCDIIAKILAVAHKSKTNAQSVSTVYQEVADFMLDKVHKILLSIVHNKFKASVGQDAVLQSNKPVPLMNVDSPALLSEYHTSGTRSPDSNLDHHGTDNRASYQSARLGDILLLGPQTFGKIISLPQSSIALAQLDVIPGSNMYGMNKMKDADSNYTYVNMDTMIWEAQNHYWKPKGTVGNSLTLQTQEDYEREAIDRPWATAGHLPVAGIPLVQMSPKHNKIIQKTKESGPVRPMSAVLKDKLDLKLDVTRRVKSAGTRREKEMFNGDDQPETQNGVGQDSQAESKDVVAGSCDNACEDTEQWSSIQTSTQLKDEDRTIHDIDDDDDLANIKSYDGDEDLDDEFELGMQRSQTPLSRSSRPRSARPKSSRKSDIVDQDDEDLAAIKTYDDDNDSNDLEDDLGFQKFGTSISRSSQTRPRSVRPKSSRHSEKMISASSQAEKCVVSQNDSCVRVFSSNLKKNVDLQGYSSEDMSTYFASARPSSSKTYVTTVASSNLHTRNDRTHSRPPSSRKPGALSDLATVEDTELLSPVVDDASDSKEKIPAASIQNDSLQSKRSTMRPFSAVDAYRYFKAHPPISARRRQETEAWQQGYVINMKAKIKDSPAAYQPPPQRPTSPISPTSSPIFIDALSPHSKNTHCHVQRANDWLGEGRDLYRDDQKQRSMGGHVPGWKDGLPESMKKRPHSAAASRAYRRSTTPDVYTPSSVAYYQSLYGMLASADTLPHMPSLEDYRPSSPERWASARSRLTCTNCKGKQWIDVQYTCQKPEDRRKSAA